MRFFCSCVSCGRVRWVTQGSKQCVSGGRRAHAVCAHTDGVWKNPAQEERGRSGPAATVLSFALPVSLSLPPESHATHGRVRPGRQRHPAERAGKGTGVGGCARVACVREREGAHVAGQCFFARARTSSLSYLKPYKNRRPPSSRPCWMRARNTSFGTGRPKVCARVCLKRAMFPHTAPARTTLNHTHLSLSHTPHQARPTRTSAASWPSWPPWTPPTRAAACPATAPTRPACWPTPGRGPTRSRGSSPASRTARPSSSPPPPTGPPRTRAR